tara:strand:- start:4880 stop:6643 length:1764 start_codon:yes stop_codon:yes gene_type:complete
MQTHSNNSHKNKNHIHANEGAQKQSSSKGVLQFKDNRSEPLQLKKIQDLANSFSSRQNFPIQKKKNNTGLPDQLKSGIENLSGYSMDDVKVHYNSDKPNQLQAHAYAQGTDIHLASGQERHLPHEAWHVVQQKQGRVQPTTQLKGNVNINDDEGLETEATIMGEKALREVSVGAVKLGVENNVHSQVIQNKSIIQQAEKDAGTSETRFITNQKGNKEKLGKEQFLEQLHSKITKEATVILKQVNQTPKDCPYIAYWFQYYGSQSALHIESAIYKFAPLTKKATGVEEFIGIIVKEAKQKLQESVRVGLLDAGSLKLPSKLASREVASVASAQLKKKAGAKLANYIQRKPVIQLGNKEKGGSQKKAVETAKEDYYNDPTKKGLDEWKDAVRSYFWAGGTDQQYIDKNYKLISKEADKYLDEEELNEKKEGKALNAMVDSSRKMNTYLGKDKNEKEKNEELDDEYESFARAVKKCPLKTFKSLSSHASRVPGMESETDIDDLDKEEIYVDPIIRFYGEGYVGKGKFKMVVNNLQAYVFTDAHTNNDYDESNAMGTKEDQIVTLPGTRLKLVSVEESSSQTVVTYEFEGD